jgi:hypothetical protein
MMMIIIIITIMIIIDHNNNNNNNNRDNPLRVAATADSNSKYGEMFCLTSATKFIFTDLRNSSYK